MKQHLCDGKWVDGPLVGCPKHNYHGRGILNRTGYTKKTKTWRVSGEPEYNNYQREHFSGRLDAKVNARPIRLISEVHKTR